MQDQAGARDQWAYYKLALAGKAGDLDVNAIESGYYRIKWGKRGWVPVATWLPPGGEARVFMVGKDARDPEDADTLDIFQRASRHPVPQADVRHWWDKGYWPGDLEAAQEDLPEPEPDATDADVPAGVGHNSGDLDARTELLGILEQAAAWAKKPPAPEAITKEIADRAANFDDRVIALEKAAKVQRDDELRPIQQEIARLQGLQAQLRDKKADWKALFDRVPDARGALKVVYVAWQRVRSLSGEDTKCGGQWGNRKAYIAKNDPLHPDTIAAREAAEKAEAERQAAIEKVQREAAQQAEKERQERVLREAEELRARRAEQDEIARQEAARVADELEQQVAAPSPEPEPEPEPTPVAPPRPAAPAMQVCSCHITDWPLAFRAFEKDERVRELITQLTIQHANETGEIPIFADINFGTLEAAQ